MIGYTKYNVVYRIDSIEGAPEVFDRDMGYDIIHAWLEQWAGKSEDHRFYWLEVEGLRVTPEEHNAAFLILGIPNLEIKNESFIK